MNNYDFLRTYQELQYTIMYDQLIDFEFGRINYCKIDTSIYWNFALTNKLLSDVEISHIEQKLHNLDIHYHSSAILVLFLLISSL